jgi:hypothetical protein
MCVPERAVVVVLGRILIVRTNREHLI